jgi:hypothetical protein
MGTPLPHRPRVWRTDFPQQDRARSLGPLGPMSMMRVFWSASGSSRSPRAASRRAARPIIRAKMRSRPLVFGAGSRRKPATPTVGQGADAIVQHRMGVRVQLRAEPLRGGDPGLWLAGTMPPAPFGVGSGRPRSRIPCKRAAAGQLQTGASLSGLLRRLDCCPQPYPTKEMRC